MRIGLRQVSFLIERSVRACVTKGGDGGFFPPWQRSTAADLDFLFINPLTACPINNGGNPATQQSRPCTDLDSLQELAGMTRWAPQVNGVIGGIPFS